MKLLNNKYNFSFEFDDDLVNELVCENPIIFSDLIIELYNAYNSNDSSFILSDNNSLIDVNSNCEIIFNPFLIDVNNKKNVDKLYSQLFKISNSEQLYLDKIELYKKINDYINLLLYQSDYNIRANQEIDIKNIFKLLDLKIDSDCSSIELDELIFNYMNVTNKLQGEKIYVFINLKSFIDINQINKLYKQIVYNKYNVLLIENSDKKVLDNERKIIIDNDGCLIL